MLAFHRGTVPSNVKLAIVQGAVLIACGAVTLMSWVLPLRPELNVAALSLGSFWFGMGVFMWACGVGFMRNQRAWLTLNDMVPAFLAIIAFGWFAVELGKQQGELSHEALPDVARMERMVPQ